MKFSTLLLDYEGTRAATITDLRFIHENHTSIYRPDNQKYLYVISTEVIDDRFFWLACEYDDAIRFTDYVVDSATGEIQPNPRTQNQVEPRQQYFACYDNKRERLFISPLAAKTAFRNFLSDASQKEYQIRNIYTSVDDFCSHIKTIKGFHFTQVDNMFSRENDIFKAVSDYGGLDIPNKLQLKVSYGETPVHLGRALIDKLHHHRDEYEQIIVIGANDEGIEQTFDFSSVIERIEIDARKDATEHYDPQEVKVALLAKLR